jgi:hypothetical protein
MIIPTTEPSITPPTAADMFEIQCMNRLQRMVQHQPEAKAEVMRLKNAGKKWSEIHKIFRFLVAELNP